MVTLEIGSKASFPPVLWSPSLCWPHIPRCLLPSKLSPSSLSPSTTALNKVLLTVLASVRVFLQHCISKKVIQMRNGRPLVIMTDTVCLGTGVQTRDVLEDPPAQSGYGHVPRLRTQGQG